MKIVIAVWSLRMGGAEVFSWHLAKELIIKGHDIYLFPLLDPYDPSLLSQVRKQNIPVLIPFKTVFFSWLVWKLHALCLRLFSFRLRDYLTKRYFLKQIKKKGIQLVISNSSLTDEFMAKSLYKIPFVSIEHGQYAISAFEQDIVNRDALVKAARVVCVSNWCARVLKETLELDSTVIYNGHLKNEATVEMLETVERKKFTFSMIARGISQKGWDVAIKAFLRVIETKDAQLVLVGAGDFLSDLQKRFDHPAILFKGQMSSIEQVVRDTDIGLFPSRKYEAFGLSILDFFSQGKPVLASNLGGIPEVIEDGLGAGGLLIQMKNKEEPDVDHLAKLMIEIMDDKLMRNSLSKNAIRIARRFDFRKTVAEYEQICLSVIQK